LSEPFGTAIVLAIGGALDQSLRREGWIELICHRVAEVEKLEPHPSKSFNPKVPE
jgi:hypothetical protein